MKATPLRGDLEQETFNIGGFELSITPNSDGGTQNAYLRVGDAQTGRYFGSLDGKELARFAKAVSNYTSARPEPGLEKERSA